MWDRGIDEVNQLFSYQPQKVCLYMSYVTQADTSPGNASAGNYEHLSHLTTHAIYQVQGYKNTTLRIGIKSF